jgi:hypothetical protein
VASKNDLEVEGNKMDHCVGSYSDLVERGAANIYSLRDPQNNPHATINIDGMYKCIDQVQGKSNSDPKPLYKSMVKEWLSKSGDSVGVKMEVDAMDAFHKGELPDDDINYEENLATKIELFFSKIVSGELTNEYGVVYSLGDEMISSLISTAIDAQEDTIYRYRFTDSQYFGDITSVPDHIVRIAIMNDLHLDEMPTTPDEWREFLNNPDIRHRIDSSDWKNVRELYGEIDLLSEEANDEISGYDYSYGLGVYPDPSDYDTEEEYNDAVNNYEREESDLYDEAYQSTLKGGFSNGLVESVEEYVSLGIMPKLGDIKLMSKE